MILDTPLFDCAIAWNVDDVVRTAVIEETPHLFLVATSRLVAGYTRREYSARLRAKRGTISSTSTHCYGHMHHIIKAVFLLASKVVGRLLTTTVDRSIDRQQPICPRPR